MAMARGQKFRFVISSVIASSLSAQAISVEVRAASGTDKHGADERTSVETAIPAVRPSALPNFHQVHPYLYRGGEPDYRGVEQLRGMGIQTVIDLRAETAVTRAEKAHLKNLGLRYINLPMSAKAPTDKQVATFMETVREARSKNAPVYVHCAHGSDRTGCLVGIWRVSEDGFSYDQAYKEMRKYYFGPKFVQLSGAVKRHVRSNRNSLSSPNSTGSWPSPNQAHPKY